MGGGRELEPGGIFAGRYEIQRLFWVKVTASGRTWRETRRWIGLLRSP